MTKEQSYQISLEDKSRLSAMLLSGGKLGNNIVSFFNTDTALAAYYSCMQKDIDNAKNCFYEAAMAYSYYTEVLNFEFCTTIGCNSFYLLSDNEKIIKRFCQYTGSPNELKSGHLYYQIRRAIQSAILNDEVSLLLIIEIIKNYTQKGRGRLFASIVDFFEGISQNNEEKIVVGVNLLQKNLQKHQPSYFKDYFALEATGFAKLAWRKGYKIDFKNNFIPQELLPIKELNQYESLHFFNYR